MKERFILSPVHGLGWGIILGSAAEGALSMAYDSITNQPTSVSNMHVAMVLPGLLIGLGVGVAGIIAATRPDKNASRRTSSPRP